MTTLRLRSLSGILTAALVLIVLPLTAAVVYGAFQLRQLAHSSDALVRDSITVTQQSQLLFQHIAAMERSANLYGVLEDPRVALAFEDNYAAFTRTLEGLSSSAPRELLSRVLSRGLATRDSIDDKSGLVGGFELLRAEADTLVEQTRNLIDARLLAVESQSAATQRRLLWAAAAQIPAMILVALMFVFFVLRPLNAVHQAISDLGRGTFSREIAVKGPADLAALGRQLEWLRTRLLGLAQERNRFLRQMSHELKTPLANIREGTDLLLDGAVGPISEDQREVATILRDNALRLQNLIENLLSFSAWKSRSGGVDLSEFRLSSLVGTVVDNQRLALASRNIALDLRVADIPLTADRAKLKLVIENLLSNAIKFTPRGGKIHLHAALQGKATIIDCADTGPGIGPDERERVFEEFYSGPTPEGIAVKGTGLGLSIVREFVQAHGGTVEIVDGEFPGAHLRIHLPGAIPLSQPERQGPAHAA